MNRLDEESGETGDTGKGHAGVQAGGSTSVGGAVVAGGGRAKAGGSSSSDGLDLSAVLDGEGSRGLDTVVVDGDDGGANRDDRRGDSGGAVGLGRISEIQ